MSDELERYRIFIASPRGLDDEREVFREVIDDYNDKEAIPRGVYFDPVGWQDTLSKIGRPQEIINDEVRTCDYFVLLLWDRWGTPPNKEDPEYTSGTEEEYHVALESFEDPDRPMKQLVMLFKAVDERQLSDPGDELQKVLEFKKEVEEKQNHLYHTFDTAEGFGDKLQDHLASWLRDHGEDDNDGDIDVSSGSGPEDSGGAVEFGLQTDEPLSDIITSAWDHADEGNLTDAEVLFSEAVVSAQDSTPYAEYGRFLWRVGRFDRAQVMLRRSVDIAVTQDDSSGEMVALNRLGHVLRQQGRQEDAEQAYRRALNIAEELDDKQGEGVASLNLGLINHDKQDYEAAHTMFERSLEISEDVGDKLGRAASLGNLAMVARDTGRYEKAKELDELAVELYEDLGDREHLAQGYGSLGQTCLRLHQYDEAEELFKESLSINEDIGRYSEAAIDYSNIARIYEEQERMEEAVTCYREALRLNKELGLSERVASDHFDLGRAYSATGDVDSSEKHFREAISMFREAEKYRRASDAAVQYGILLEENDRQPEAYDAYREGLEYARELTDVSLEAHALYHLAMLHESRGALEEARWTAERSEQLYRESSHDEQANTVAEFLEALEANQYYN